MRYPRTTLLSLVAAAGFALASAPASAQSSVDELTVVGRFGPDGPQTLSRTVSYRDLDLTRPGDQEVLRGRIKDTATALCNELGESAAGGSPLVPSCRDGAIRDAQIQARTAIASATPRIDYAGPVAADASAIAADASATVSDPEPVAAVSEQPATMTVETVTNGPVPDTAANRVRYGQPMSNAGKHTQAAGN